MQSVEPNWTALIAFTVAWAISCLAGFFVSGSLPLSLAPKHMRQGSGPALVATNTVMLGALVIATLLFGAAELRWSSLVIAAGAVFLFAPAVIQELPASLKDTKLGHAVVLAAVGIAFAMLFMFGAHERVREFIIG